MPAAWDGSLNMHFGLAFGATCCGASLLGVLAVSQLVRRSGKVSLTPSCCWQGAAACCCQSVVHGASGNAAGLCGCASSLHGCLHLPVSAAYAGHMRNWRDMPVETCNSHLADTDSVSCVQASIVVMLLAGVVGSGALLTAGFGGRAAVQDLVMGRDLAFMPLCRGHA